MNGVYVILFISDDEDQVGLQFDGTELIRRPAVVLRQGGDAGQIGLKRAYRQSEHHQRVVHLLTRLSNVVFSLGRERS